MAETSAANSLVTPAGTLTLNGASRPRLLVTGLPGFDSPQLRVTVDNMPQGSGAIGHNAPWAARHFDLVALMDVDSAADRATLDDDLKAAIETIRDADGRYYFTPSGKAQRFCTVRLDGEVTEESVQTGAFGEAVGFRKKVTIPLRADNPYNLTAAQQTDVAYSQSNASGHPEIASGGSLALVNNGTAPTWPVLKVWGPYSAFTIHNTTLDTALGYSTAVKFGHENAMSVGSGHYVEIILGPVVHTAYLDGSSTNMLGYQDSDSLFWWYLQRGSNTITANFTGGGGGTKVELLVNDGWL
jgi:hypothetical protein